ncbi:ELL-associated factor 1 [Ananas comosus]|uniref:ELL-associated factor 1 n=2 Tax=Ananas comosus TaxID=4615 RepID=A0A6P5FWH5_ANACO|nr:ELL-associated factor 1 [Ananas comosus]CAD1822352.1 unnamed protein product [Ananas comosus var. bracteatus]
MANNNGEPSSAPQHDRWYNIRLGRSFRDHASTKFCTLRYEFKPASIDKTQPGSLHKSKENRVTVEFHNNQPGKPKVTFEGSSEECKDNDGVLFFDGETFRLERLHRAVKRLRHIRLPGESAAAVNLAAASSAGTGADSGSPPLAKVAKAQPVSKPIVPSVPVEVEKIDVGEPDSPGPKPSNKNSAYHSIISSLFSTSPDPKSPEQEENLDILGDDDPASPAKTMTTGQQTPQGAADLGFDINIPTQDDTDDEIADVDVNDDVDEGLNAAEALRAQVNAEEGGKEPQEEDDDTSSSSASSSSSGSSGSGSGSGSSSSESDGSDADSASSGGDIDV